MAVSGQGSGSKTYHITQLLSHMSIIKKTLESNINIHTAFLYHLLSQDTILPSHTPVKIDFMCRRMNTSLFAVSAPTFLTSRTQHVYYMVLHMQ